MNFSVFSAFIIKISCILSLFISAYSYADLDADREAGFQRAFKRYTKKATNSTSASSLVSTTATEESRNSDENEFSEITFARSRQRLRIREEAIVLEKQIFSFVQKSNNDESEFLSTNGFYLNRENLLQDGIKIKGSEILYFDLYNKSISLPGSYILVKSKLNSFKRDEFESSVYNYQREQKLDDITYSVLGEISFTKINDDSSDQRITFLNTFGFDPCFVEASASLFIRKKLNEESRQRQIDLAAQCVLGKDLDGKIFASIILVEENGKIYKQIDLEGEITLRVAEALYLRYTLTKNDNENRLFNYVPDFESEEIEDDLEPESRSTFFKHYKDLDGRYEGLTIENKSDEEQICINKKSFTLAKYDNETESLPLFLFQYSASCDENRKDEDEEDEFEVPEDDNNNTFDPDDYGKRSSTELSFGNSYQTFNNPATVFSYKNTDQDLSYRKSHFFTAARVKDTKGKFNIYEFGIESEKINFKGITTTKNFRLVHSRDQSYVVAEYIILRPINNLTNRLRYQQPQISDVDRKQALNDFKHLELTDDQINASLDYNDDRSELGLCATIYCYELGVGVTFSNQGGVFVTARGETVADLFGKKVEVEVVAGLPLNSNGVNHSFRQFSYPESSFIELEVSLDDCKITKEFCGEFKLVKTDNKKRAQFVMEHQF